MEWFLRSNSTLARMLRTVAQGLLGVIMAELPEIIGLFNLPDYVQAIIVAVVMAICSSLMSELGKYVEQVNAAKRLKAQQEKDSEDQETAK